MKQLTQRQQIPSLLLMPVKAMITAMKVLFLGHVLIVLIYQKLLMQQHLMMRRIMLM